VRLGCVCVCIWGGDMRSFGLEWLWCFLGSEWRVRAGGCMHADNMALTGFGYRYGVSARLHVQ